MNDLVVSLYTPTVDRGRAVRTYGVVRALAARAGTQMQPVDVLYKRFGAEVASPLYTVLAGVSLHGVEASRGVRRGLMYARARAQGMPETEARQLAPELKREALRLASMPGRGRVIADGPAAAGMLLGLARRRPVVYLAHNVESDLRATLREGTESSTESEQRGDRAHARYERRLLQSASESWMASRADMKRARAIAPGARLRYVPNVVDVGSISSVIPAHDRRTVLLVGDFGYTPNARALELLLNDVMPRVWEQLPEAELLVAGHKLHLPVGTDPRVTGLGFVENLATVYERASCVVVPLLEGGGSPLKFVEAMAYGLPIVATSRAAAGLEVSAGTHYVQADTPSELAGALVQVLSRRDPLLGRHARALAERHYSIEALRDLLRAEGS
ncbi:MAG TPA: glycosyltransferase family 4 protein [Solirubrobacteraceae bacterium]|nr:glycosyltransferase family 4 protein [Solirubrobacteraceae bacterium]